MDTTRVLALTGFTDSRGRGFPIPAEVLSFLGSVAEMHVATLARGAVRGNHVHRGRQEALVVLYSDGCEVAWQEEGSEAVQQEIRLGSGALVLLLDPGVAHAVRNPGDEPLFLTALSDRLPGPEDTDTWRSELLT